MSSKKDTIRSIYERWNQNDFALDAFHPEVEWLTPYPDGHGFGREGMAAAIREYNKAWAELELTVQEVRELDQDRVVVFFTERARGRHSGMERANESTALVTFRDGLIVRFEGWLHRQDAYSALGLERAPDGSPVVTEAAKTESAEDAGRPHTR